MDDRWERNCTILSPERQRGVRAQALESKCLRSSHQSLTVKPRASYLRKNSDNGMTFPFGSHVSLERDHSCKAQSSASCTWCSTTVSKWRRALVAHALCTWLRPSHNKSREEPLPWPVITQTPQTTLSLSHCLSRDGASFLSIPATSDSFILWLWAVPSISEHGFPPLSINGTL